MTQPNKNPAHLRDGEPHSIVKQCTSCGQNGHHWNECPVVSVFDLLGACLGFPPKPVEELHADCERAERMRNMEEKHAEIE